LPPISNCDAGIAGGVATGSNAAPDLPPSRHSFHGTRRENGTSAGPTPPKVTAVLDAAGADTSILSLESTQTPQALTPLELGQNEDPRWFGVQLACRRTPSIPTRCSPRYFQPATACTPLFDGSGTAGQALRLGGLEEDVGAAATSPVISHYYDSPIIKRVSVDETRSFSRQASNPQDVAEPGRSMAIEITTSWWFGTAIPFGSRAPGPSAPST